MPSPQKVRIHSFTIGQIRLGFFFGQMSRPAQIGSNEEIQSLGFVFGHRGSMPKKGSYSRSFVSRLLIGNSGQGHRVLASYLAKGARCTKQFLAKKPSVSVSYLGRWARCPLRSSVSQFPIWANGPAAQQGPHHGSRLACRKKPKNCRRYRDLPGQNMTHAILCYEFQCYWLHMSGKSAWKKTKTWLMTNWVRSLTNSYPPLGAVMQQVVELQVAQNVVPNWQ